MFLFLRNLWKLQCFPYLLTDWCRINGSLCEPSQSCNICTSHLCPDGNWPLFHCMVFRLWGHIYQIHPRSQEGATHQICRLNLHGSWIPFPNPLGWHLCMIMSFFYAINFLSVINVIFYNFLSSKSEFTDDCLLNP